MESFGLVHAQLVQHIWTARRRCVQTLGGMSHLVEKSLRGRCLDLNCRVYRIEEDGQALGTQNPFWPQTACDSIIDQAMLQ